MNKLRQLLCKTLYRARSMLLLLPLLAFGESAIAEDWVRVRMTTSLGDIVLELDRQNAPITVVNFLRYAREGFYNNTIFHRVIDGFMIQGGGFREQLVRKKPRKPIRNEAHNGLQNRRTTIAMARTSQPHSATSQFFINLGDNDFLNFKSKTAKGWGYAVFGWVAAGMEVVDRIAKIPVRNQGGFQNVPLKPVVITSITVL